MSNRNVILADGSFPVHEIPLEILRNASLIVCCDGSVASLIAFGLIPDAIVGDCDSIDPENLVRFSDRIFRDDDQETNDLTKAVRWCINKGINDLVILGATGKREDHTIGNISLLADYAKQVRVRMVTDTGTIFTVLNSGSFSARKGQQVSIFSLNPDTEITSFGLKYPLVKRQIKSWWEATLNETTGDTYSLDFEGGPVIVYERFFSPSP
jgi:thiamine pyrophosphokinase